MTAGAARVVAGRYRLVRAVGRGGMGAVWQAYDELLDREVAVKQIWIAGADELDDLDDPMVRRALREAQAAARLRHPGVVTVHDVVTDRGRPWLVMELVSGRSMAQAIAEHGLLTEQRTAQIGLPVVEALQAAHRAGIIHRDVKPANIMLEDSGRVVLTDFGIAMIDDRTALTATGQLLGSPAYLAPERINGRPAGAASDLWALGVTLYTAVTGQSPFQREDTQATVAAVLAVEPATPAHAGRLWPVLKGLLLKDPELRLTAEQAAPLLAKVAGTDGGDDAGSAGPATGRAQRRRPPASRRDDADRPDGLPATVIAPPPTLAAPTEYQPSAQPPPSRAAPAEDEPSAQPPPTPTEPELAPADAVTAFPESTLPEIPEQVVQKQEHASADTLDTGAAPATSATEAPSPVEEAPRTRRRLTIAAILVIVLVIAGGIAARQANRENTPSAGASPSAGVAGVPDWTSFRGINSDNAEIWALAWSPDGKYLAFSAGDGTLSVHDSESREFRYLEGADTRILAVAYSPDGKHLATGSHGDDAVRVWDLASGEPRTLTGYTGSVNAVAFSPDGQNLATGNADNTVRVWDLAGGESRTITGHTGSVRAVAFSPDGRYLATASDDGTSRVWDMTGGEFRTLSGHTGSVRAVTFSPDGRYLATGSGDKTIRVWDLATAEARILTGHEGPVTAVAYSPDGRYLVTGSEDGTVRVWDVASGASRTLTGGPEGPVNAVAFNPDGKRFATTSEKSIGIWYPSPG